MMFLVNGILLLLLSPAIAGGQDASRLAREIEDQLIAPCCWSQPVSQHSSEAAMKIRQEVREMLAAGKTRDQILDYYIAQYGERILSMPRARGFNLLAYVMPVAALLFSFLVIAIVLRKWASSRGRLPDTGIAGAIPDQTISARMEEELRDLD